MPKIFKISAMAMFIGLVSAIFSSLFLHLLAYTSTFRSGHPYLIWGLPVFGLLFALILKKIPHHINQGVPYILEEIENEKAKVSTWMAPFILLSSLGTHLFGGSAGREGVGVIMGASVAHYLPKFHKTFSRMRPYLVYGGIAAGFSSIFGTPLTAIIFAFELNAFKHWMKLELIICAVISAFSALFVQSILGPAHQHFQVSFDLNKDLLVYGIIVIFSSGIGANIFYWGLKGYTKLISSLFPELVQKMFFGGLLISSLVFFTDGHQYIGIGTDTIARSFFSEMSHFDFMMKCLLTVMTLSVGFKGGEVTPLLFMGATLSNGMAAFFGLRNFGLSSSLGMVSLFGAVTGTPFASAMMGMELFGWQVGVMAFLTCLGARLFMAKRSVYRH